MVKAIWTYTQCSIDMKKFGVCCFHDDSIVLFTSERLIGGKKHDPPFS